jgi:hypothetical protein
MKYLNLQTNNEPYAWALSSAIWKITNPFTDENLSDYYSTPVVNKNGIWALPIGDELYRIHPRADFSSLLHLVQTSDAEKVALHNALKSLRGKRVTIAELIPPAWTPAIMTEETAKSQGWFESKSE